MSSLRTPTGVFFVRSAEQIPCPCCSGRLKAIGSRKRSCIDSLGDKIILVIRRLRCVACRRIHHELPDLLVPYRRHIRESIEAAVGGVAPRPMTPPCGAGGAGFGHWLRISSVALPLFSRPLCASVCGRPIHPSRVRAPQDLAVGRGWRELAGQSCPPGGQC
ncbi:MAG: DUF6431 domain-containing protein [Bacillota bacterium]